MQVLFRPNVAYFELELSQVLSTCHVCENKCITMYVLKLNTWLIQKTLKTCPGRVYNVKDGCCLGNIKITKEQTVFSVVSVSG